MSPDKIVVRKKPLTIPVKVAEKGGPGSGNYGHSGRPGLRGGSGGRGTISTTPIPSGDITFGKPDSKYAEDSTQGQGAMLNGIPLTSVGEQDWSSIPDVDVGEPPMPQAKRLSSGVIVEEPDGRVWICEVANHYDGLEHSWSKGRIESGLTSQQNAIKEAYEELGLQVEITGHIMDYVGGYTTSRYYTARRTGGSPHDAGWETDNVKLVNPSTARDLFNFNRDRLVLDVYLATSAISGEKGGPGSGNWGHAGRVGLVGGSAPTKTGVGAMMSLTSGPTAAQRAEEARRAGGAQTMDDLLNHMSAHVRQYWYHTMNTFGISSPSDLKLTAKDVQNINNYHRGLITEEELVETVIDKVFPHNSALTQQQGIKTGDVALMLKPSDLYKFTQEALKSGYIDKSDLEEGPGIKVFDYEAFPEVSAVIQGWASGGTPTYELWDKVFNNPSHPDRPKPVAPTPTTPPKPAGAYGITPLSAGAPHDADNAAVPGNLLSDAVQKANPGATADRTWSGATMGERGNLKDAIINQITARNPDLEYEQVNTIIKQWAMSSNDTDMRSLALQKDASDEFGVPLSRWQQDNYASAKAGGGKHSAEPLYNSDVQRATLRAMYENTQAMFESHGYKPDDTIRLYRGTGLGSVRSRTGYGVSLKKGDVVNYTGNAMESWSVSLNAAKNFGSIWLRLDVPVRNVIGSAASGFGCLGEGEFVIMGGSLPGATATIEYTY